MDELRYTTSEEVTIDRTSRYSNVKWLLEKDVFEENIEAMKAAIVDQGMEYRAIDYIPDEKLYRNMFKPEDCVVVWGSLGLAREVQRDMPWIPGAWCNLKNLECVHYYCHLGEFLLNDRYIMIPYGDLVRQKEFLIDTLSKNGKLFMRPSSGFKLFTGTVIPVNNYEHEVEHLGFYSFELDKVVIVASPVELAEEWRLVVVDKEVVAGSLYVDCGEKKVDPFVPPEVIEFGNKVAAKWQPEVAFVLDVCRTKTGDLRLLELNSFSSSGIYACDKAAVVAAASKAALKEFAEYL